MNSQDCYKILTEAGFVQKSSYSFIKEIDNKIAYRAYLGRPTNDSEQCRVTIYEENGFSKIVGSNLSSTQEELQKIVNQIKS